MAEALKDRRGGAGRGQGRKTEDGVAGLKRRNVSLDDDTVTALIAFGDGNLSVGIRRAAKLVGPKSE